MEHQSVRIHPSTQAGQRTVRCFPTATQHHSVIGVSHHHHPGLTHFNVKVMKVNVGDQGADNSALRTTRRWSPTRQVYHDVLLEKLLHEFMYPDVRNPTSHFREKG